MPSLAAVVQELLEKVPQLPPDIQWHFIGHLQSNKVTGLGQLSSNTAIILYIIR